MEQKGMEVSLQVRGEGSSRQREQQVKGTEARVLGGRGGLRGPSLNQRLWLFPQVTGGGGGGGPGATKGGGFTRRGQGGGGGGRGSWLRLYRALWLLRGE